MDATNRFGCHITDAKQDLKVHVKSEDIKGAICCDHQKCAIARAILRQREGTAKWVDVGASVALIGTGEKTAKRYKLSAEARKHVKYFDTHEGRFAPCSVNLKSPSETQKIGARIGVKQGTVSSKRSKKSIKRLEPTR